MALTTAQLLRARLRASFKIQQDYIWGDGTATAFQLSGYPIPSGVGSASAFVLVGAGALTATGGTAWQFDQGIVAFATALSAGSGALLSYYWSPFSDAEIEAITALCPTLDEMTLEGLGWLAGDLARQKKWSMAQGPSVDPSAAQKAIFDLIAFYQDNLFRHTTGGIESWAESSQSGGGYGLVNRD